MAHRVVHVGCRHARRGQAPTRVLLIRHAEAAYETPGSGDSGGSLTTKGRQQARRLGERLQQFNPEIIVCSELSRAVQTAEIAAAVLSVPVEVRMGLQEYDVGNERGRPYDPQVFEPLLCHWLAGDLSEPIPGGEDGHAVSQRVLAVLNEVSRRFAGRTIAAVSHGGAIISVLGTLSPRGPHLPVDGNDMPGCDMYVLLTTGHRWEVMARERGADEA